MAARRSNDCCLWREALVLFTAILLLVTFSGVAADDSPAPMQSPIWIQDPWTGDSVLAIVNEPDYSLWNGARIEDYEHAIAAEAPPPLGILSIESVNIQVPIYNGTDEFNLDRGAGRIRGMAKTGEEGNLGISGHRDGFFRSIKDIQVGDDIVVQTTHGVVKYAVSDITIVPKEDESVLVETADKRLTLVTCYPFYFVGNAPKRYIVTAMPKTLSLE
mgnify:FL=1